MKRFTALTLAGCTLLLNGCSESAVEVRDRIFIQSIGLHENLQTELTLYPFEPAGTHLTASGSTIDAAVEEAAVKSGRSVFMGHTELLSFDDPSLIAKLPGCMEDYRLSPACKLLYLHETKLPEDCDTTLLTDQLRQEEENGRIPETDLFHILSECQSRDGAALIPTLTEDGFTMSVIQGEQVLGTLSDRAVQGLCWLRGDNFPGRISVVGNEGVLDYEISSARTELSSEIRSGIPYVTVTVHLKGSGNAEAAGSMITVLCKAAELETVKQLKADVIGLETCLAKDCPEYLAQQDFETAKWAVEFEHVILTE